MRFSSLPALLLAVCGVSSAAVACGDGLLGSRPSPDQQVLAAQSCPESRCFSLEGIRARTGFDPIEPSEDALPPGFGLYARYLLERRQRVTLAEEPAGPPALVLEYRFLESPYVAALYIVETLPPEAGPISLNMRDESCGLAVTLARGIVYYGNGGGLLMPGEAPGEFVICPAAHTGSIGDEALNAHTLYLARDGVIIEVKAFPEAGVSKQDMLRIADALLAAEPAGTFSNRSTTP